MRPIKDAPKIKRLYAMIHGQRIMVSWSDTWERWTDITGGATYPQDDPDLLWLDIEGRATE